MGKVLNDEQVRAYRERGIHFPLKAFSEEEMGKFRAKLNATRAMMGGRLAGKYNQKPHLLFPWIDELVRHRAILDAVEGALGSPDLLCWSAAFFAKDPGDGTFISWHQDATYWGLSSPDVLTAWLAFTPSTVESGCMRVVPGTHRTQMAHEDTFAQGNLLTRGQEIAVEIDEAQAEDVVLRPGEFSLHHVLIVHGSKPNNAPLPRVGLAIRYIPTHLKQIATERDSATLVRGTDRYGHFDPEKAPVADMDPAALARHAAIAERQARLFYRGTARAG